MDAPKALLQGARLRLKVRAQELYEAGATKDQAYFMALEEAWRDEIGENARLWDQAAEIDRVRTALESLIEAVENECRTYLAPSTNRPMSLNVRNALDEAKAVLGREETRVIS